MAVSPMAIIQTGFGLGQATAGYLKSHEAEFKKADVRQQMEDTRYADYNQAYYEELNRRAQVGLPEEQVRDQLEGQESSFIACLRPCNCAEAVKKKKRPWADVVQPGLWPITQAAPRTRCSLVQAVWQGQWVLC